MREAEAVNGIPELRTQFIRIWIIWSSLIRIMY